MALYVDIKKQLGDFRLDVQLEAGDERLALLGSSGCGKSVTLKCIAGIIRPDEGRIELNGVTLFDSAAKIDLPPQKRAVGYLFQNYALFPNMTVRQNIAVAVRERGGKEKTVAEKLRQFRLEDVTELKPAQLSGGQQQRTALARILASKPAAILLDEPFSALDSFLKYQLELELAETLDSFGGPVLWVSHDRNEVYRNCERVCVLDNGHGQGVGSMAALFSRPGTEAAARLSGCKNYADAIGRGSAVELPQWGITLDCRQTTGAKLRCVGIRSHHVRQAQPGEQNAFDCELVRVVEDVFEDIILLRPLSAAAGVPLLRMEMPKAQWPGYEAGAKLTVSVRPEDILLLE